MLAKTYFAFLASKRTLAKQGDRLVNVSLFFIFFWEPDPAASSFAKATGNQMGQAQNALKTCEALDGKLIWTPLGVRSFGGVVFA